MFTKAPGGVCVLLEREAANQEKWESQGQAGRSRQHGDSLHHPSLQRGEEHVLGTHPLSVVVVFRSACTSNKCGQRLGARRTDLKSSITGLPLESTVTLQSRTLGRELKRSPVPAVDLDCAAIAVKTVSR